MVSSLSIIVTRPDPAGAELCQQIQMQGDRAIHFPTIAFASPADEYRFEQTVMQVGEQNWLIFISPQAVRASNPAIRRAWPHLPATVHFAAVGAGTANALSLAGYHVACQPVREWSSEGLLEMAEFQTISHQRVMIVRGEGGREFLEPALIKRGAQVSSLVAYRRILPQVDVAPYLPLLMDGKVDVIICTSFEGVANLKQLVGIVAWPALKQIPLIVMSERIKALALEAGFQTIWVTDNASQQAILAVITQKRKELCQSR